MIKSNVSNLLVRLKSLRFVTLLVIWALIIDDFLILYRSFMTGVGLRDSFVILPFLQTNDYFMKVIRLASLCFFSNAPFMDRSEMYILQRLGKIRWGWRNLTYLFAGSVILTVCLNVLTILLNLPAESLSGEWGEALRTLAVNSEAIGGSIIVDSAILNQFSPVQLFSIQFLVDMIAFYLLGLLLYVLSLFVNRVIAYIIVIAVLFLPSVVGWVNFAGVYFSPFSWIDMGNWRIGYDLSKPDFVYMFVGYILLCMVLMVIGQYRIKRIDWENQEG